METQAQADSPFIEIGGTSINRDAITRIEWRQSGGKYIGADVWFWNTNAKLSGADAQALRDVIHPIEPAAPSLPEVYEADAKADAGETDPTAAEDESPAPEPEKHGRKKKPV
jgi:hypothetical protein